MSGMVPIIGLTTLREITTWEQWTEPTTFLQATYTDTITVAGGTPVLLPPPDRGLLRPEDAGQVIARLDGLIITGGTDVDPSHYGENAHPNTDQPRPERDTWELALLRAADRVALPTLGICRGAQLIALEAGGRLHQHLPEVIGHGRHSPSEPVFTDTEITTTPGSVLNSLVGDRVIGGCHHHQAIADHPGFSGTAHAADGTVEGIEIDAGPTSRHRFCVGIQWHPETRPDVGLFNGLITAAARHATNASSERSPSAAPEN